MSSIVYLVDDDTEVLKSLGFFLRSSRLQVEPMCSGEAFEKMVAGEQQRVGSNAVWPTDPCCLILDINMPGISGTELFEWLKARALTDVMPVVFITGHGDVAMAVGLVKSGAFDFIEKPINPERLVQIITEAHTASGAALMKKQRDQAVMRRWLSLTPRERETLLLLEQGLNNEEVCSRLGIALATVKTHRLEARKKLGVRGVAELRHHVPAELLHRGS